jgi:glc operon protein GlcG
MLYTVSNVAGVVCSRGILGRGRTLERMPELTLQAADVLTTAAFDYARQHGLVIAVAILDAGGNVVRVSRMDGCNFLSPDIARGKAFGAVAWKLPSAELGKRFTTPGAASGMVGISGQRVVPHQGALPIWSDGRCIGAIGVSGARSDDDEDAARAALGAAGFSEGA